MNRFWEDYILPVFQAATPKVIVEVGSASGANTEKIMHYCVETGSRLIAVDPAPAFDINAFQRKYGDRFSIRLDLSLNVLPELTDYDVILIDGDHNWYTVYNELLCVENYALKIGRWPIIIFHDIGWPYARRDLYYVPETIPAKYRQPYARKGMAPFKSELVNDGEGIQPNNFNAEHEGGPRNGVMTAIEDFIAQSDTGFRFVEVIGDNGLGILVSSEALRANEKLEKFLDEIDLPVRVRGRVLAQENKLNYLLCRLNKCETLIARADGADALVQERTIDKLSRDLQAAEGRVREMLTSKRWKLGNAIGNAFDALTFKRLRKSKQS